MPVAMSQWKEASRDGDLTTEWLGLVMEREHWGRI